MAERGTFTGEVQRAWTRFLGLGWKAKASIIAVAVVLTLGFIAAATPDDTDKQPTASAASLDVSATPAKDTPTPKPTETPKPTNTPKPTETPDTSAPESAYRAAFVRGTNDMARDLERFAALADRPDPANAKWRSDMTAVADIMIVTARTMRDLTPPSLKWAEFDLAQRLAMDAYIEAMVLMKSGVNNLSVSAINDSTARMRQASSLLSAATAKIPK